MTDFYSRNDVNYNGDVYSIPFPYIKEKEVQVFLDDTLFEDWFFLNDSQIKLRTIPQEVTSNTIVSVRRVTDIDKKVVTYTNNTLLNKENLNLSQDQLLYAVQEIYDNNTQFAIDIRAEVDEKVERVSDAVEKLEFLEDSVAIANEAALEATEQAQIATEKAEETLNTYNEAMAEIETLRQNSIEDIDQLVTDHTNDLNSLDATIKKDADAIINRVGLNMFDTVLKDHILTYEESKGLALQGTWVYKDAIAGERYGYPDFYNKCLEEYNEATATETVNGVTIKVHSNGHKFYDIADKTGVDDFFNTMGTAWFYGVDTTEERVFLPRNNFFDQATGDVSEVGQSVEAGLPNITDEMINHSRDYSLNPVITPSEKTFYNKSLNNGKKTSYPNVAGNNGGSYAGDKVLGFDLSRGNNIYGNSNTVQPNAVKKLLYICVGNTVSGTSWVDVVTQVKEGVKDIEEAKDEAVEVMKNVVGGTVPIGFIGFSALGIDETLNLQRNLNGQVIMQDQFKGFTKFIKRRIELYPDLACTESEWQTEVTMSANGVCDKFVIDDNAGTIRLPKYPQYLDFANNTNGTSAKTATVSVYGNGKVLGITDGNAQYSLKGDNGSYGLLIGNSAQNTSLPTGTGWGKPQNLSGRGVGITTNKTNSGLTGSVTIPAIAGVTSEKIKGTYFIQVATGAETEDNIINEIELNNPYSLGDSKYSPIALNNLSWLKSEGQYNPKTVYPAVYDLLLKEYNNPDRFATFNKDAFTVVGSPTITEDGMASGFSSSNYLTKSLTFPSINKRLDITTPVINISNTFSSQENIFEIYNNTDSNDCCFVRRTSATNLQIFFRASASWVIKDLTIQQGNNYQIRFVWDGSTYYIYTKTNNTDWTLGTSFDDSSVSDRWGNCTIYLGSYQNKPFEGSIDLKQFSITVDGKKVFSGANSKVKLTTETFTDYDFVLNTVDETFRLPLLNGSEDLIGNRYEDLTLNASGSNYIAPANGWFDLRKGASDGQFIQMTSAFETKVYQSTGNNEAISAFLPVTKGNNVQIHYSASGVTYAFRFVYAQGNGSLYFYVGETVQNANLVNVGRIQETYTTKSMVDGQWVLVTQTLASSFSLASQAVSTYNLGSILPNDGYNYEVWFTVAGSTGTTSGNSAEIRIGSDLMNSSFNIVCANTTRSSANVIYAGTTVTPVGASRNINITNTGNATASIVLLRMAGYRRIGTNL